MLAVDHGYFLGPTSGLECAETIRPLAPYADTLMLTRGVLRTCIRPAPLRRSCCGSPAPPAFCSRPPTSHHHLHRGGIRLNAAGMALSIFVGAPHQHQTIANLAKLVDEGERYGIPVLAVTAVGKDMGRDARYLAPGPASPPSWARTGQDLLLRRLREGHLCPVPVVIAGGKKLPEREALE